MVCEKCQEKLGKVVVPDKWKEGARNTTGTLSSPWPIGTMWRRNADKAVGDQTRWRRDAEGGGRRVGADNRLVARTARNTYGSSRPYGGAPVRDC